MGLKQVFLPKLGESVMEATIIKWNKVVGDLIEKDENLLEIATDKVDTEIPSPYAGVIQKILFSPESIVAIGSVIAIIETAEQNDVQKAGSSIPQETDNTSFVETPLAQSIAINEEIYCPKIDSNQPAENIISEDRFYSPLVLSIAAKEKVSFSELNLIVGTGENGRVSKKDLLKYISNRTQSNTGLNSDIKNTHNLSQPSHGTPNENTHHKTPEFNQNQHQKIGSNQQVNNDTSTSEKILQVNSVSNNEPNKVASSNTPMNEITSNGLTEIIEMSRMRKVISKNMVESKRVSPHVTSFAEVDVTEIIKWRNSIKESFEKNEGVKLTLTPIFIDCLIKTLVKFPLLNSSIVNDKIIVKKYFNIGMATALPSGDLIVPVIKNAHYLNLVGITHAVNNLSTAARANKLEMENIEGGTFTLTNIGSFGSLMGTPIILQPQVAILAIGQIKKRAMVIEQPDNDIIAIRSMMFISLSYDHRIIDGALASNFLKTFTDICQQFTKD